MTAQAWAVPAEISDWVACSGVLEGASPLSAETIFGTAANKVARSTKTMLRPKARRAGERSEESEFELGIAE